MDLPQFIFFYMVTSTLWNCMWTFRSLSSCIWSPLPNETLYEPSTYYLRTYSHLYPINLYIKLWHFIFINMVTFTLWNFIWTFLILSSWIWSPLSYETLYEPSAFYLYVYVHRYPMKFYISLPRFNFMYLFTVTLWNLVWTFRILSLCKC